MRISDGLGRALSAARRANLAAAGEAAPIPGSPGVTRRRLLAGIAAAGIGAGLPRPARAAPLRGGRVAIIGGGMAGLSALHHLRAAGVDARLYEGRKRIGGRMHTVRHADGTLFERGGQLVNTDHADMFAFMKRFGIDLVDRKTAPHRTLVIADGALVSDERLAEALRPIAAQIDSDAERLDRDYDRVARELDRMSIAGYLDAHAALMPQAWVRDLMAQTSRTEYGAEPDRCSALGLIFNLPVVDGERVEILGGSDERYLIRGGSQTLAEAVARAHADRIEQGRELISIAREHGRISLTFRDLSVEHADRVIVALPGSIVRLIEWRLPLPAEWHRFMAAIELGRNEKIQAVMPDMPWARAMGAGGELWQTDGHALAASGWDGSVSCDRPVPVFTWFQGGNQVDGAPGLDDLGSQSAAALPLVGARTGAVDRTAWARDPMARGAYVNIPPGLLTRFGHLMWSEDEHGAATQSARAGDVVFAGEHLSDAYPGYMNGGAQTGRLAAAAILGRTIAPDAA